MPLLRDGRTFSKHTTLEKGFQDCPMSRRKAPSDAAERRLIEALEAAFFEYFGLSSNEWNPDADEASAARAALDALRAVNFLVVDGQVYLVTASHEVDESGGERQWRITTDDEGGGYADDVD